MYREHKRAELRQDMVLLEAFVSRSSAAGGAGDLYFYDKILSFDTFNKSTPQQLPLLLLKNLIEKFGLDCFIQRKLKLPNAPTAKNSDIIDTVMRLDEVASMLFTEPNAAPSSKRGGKKKIKKKAVDAMAEVRKPIASVEEVLGEEKDEEVGAEGILRAIGKRIARVVASGGVIDFKEVFSEGSTLPVKMEICSGSGEWASQQVLTIRYQK